MISIMKLLWSSRFYININIIIYIYIYIILNIILYKYNKLFYKAQFIMSILMLSRYKIYEINIYYL